MEVHFYGGGRDRAVASLRFLQEPGPQDAWEPFRLQTEQLKEPGEGNWYSRGGRAETSCLVSLLLSLRISFPASQRSLFLATLTQEPSKAVQKQSTAAKSLYPLSKRKPKRVLICIKKAGVSHPFALLRTENFNVIQSAESSRRQWQGLTPAAGKGKGTQSSQTPPEGVQRGWALLEMNVQDPWWMCKHLCGTDS